LSAGATALFRQAASGGVTLNKAELGALVEIRNLIDINRINTTLKDEP